MDGSDLDWICVRVRLFLAAQVRSGSVRLGLVARARAHLSAVAAAAESSDD